MGVGVYLRGRNAVMAKAAAKVPKQPAMPRLASQIAPAFIQSAILDPLTVPYDLCLAAART